MFLKFHIISYILLLSLGITFRLVNFGSYPFIFDQIQIVENAGKIIQGDLIFIGPKTGPATMYTGPLIYYLGALSSLFIPGPYLLAPTSIMIWLITGFTLYYLGRQYLPHKRERFLLLALWSISPLLVVLDRITWNPNLTLLAASLCFFPLLNRQPPQKKDYVCLLLGGFLGYQAHFSGLFLPILVLLMWIFHMRRHIVVAIAPFIGLMLSLIPLILFDSKHQWMNLTGLTLLLTNKEDVSRFLFFERLNHNLKITLENVGKVIIPSSHDLILYGGGALCLLLFVIFYIKKFKNFNPEITLPIAWIISITLLFSFYRHSTPEYYFLIQIPAILFVLTRLISDVFSYKPAFSIIFIILFIMVVKSNLELAHKTGHLTLKDQVDSAAYIRTEYPNNPVEIIFPPGQSVGLEYLLKDKTQDSSKQVIRIIFPTQSDETYDQTFGLIGLTQVK